MNILFIWALQNQLIRLKMRCLLTVTEIQTSRLIYQQHRASFQVGLGIILFIFFFYSTFTFSVFWDLYSVHSDKKDKAEPSNDAKTYHKMVN